MLGSIGILLFGTVFFDLLATRDFGMISVGMVLAIGCIYALLYGPEGSLFSSQFPPEVRYSGISLAVQTSGAIGGGLAPLVATWLLSVGDGSPQYVVWYLMGLGAIAGFCAWRMRARASVLEAQYEAA
jgi:hypothetical protein